MCSGCGAVWRPAVGYTAYLLPLPKKKRRKRGSERRKKNEGEKREGERQADRQNMTYMFNPEKVR